MCSTGRSLWVAIFALLLCNEGVVAACVNKYAVIRSLCLFLDSSTSVADGVSTSKTPFWGIDGVTLAVSGRFAALGWLSAPHLPAYDFQIFCDGEVETGDWVQGDLTSLEIIKFFNFIKTDDVQSSIAFNSSMYIPYLSKSGTEGDSKYPNITDSYTTRPLRGVVSSTLVEVDTYPSDWNEEDEIQSRNSWLLGLISLSYMANAAYCANVSFVIDLVPHWDKRARVSLPSVGTALLRNYSTEIFANMGISALREYQEQVSASWKRAGVAIDDSFISFAILTRLKSSYLNPCGISTGGVNAFIVRIQTSDCSHWEGYTLVMHETLHVFQACDEYGDCECECKRSWCIDEPPYYCTNNLNCHRCMPAHKCVMGVDWTHPCVCPWTALQVGWGPMARDDVICNLPILPGSAYVSANGCPGQQHQSMVLLYFLLVIMAFQ